MFSIQRDSWWSHVFVFRGGVVPLIARGLASYLCYTTLLYVVSSHVGSDVGLRDEGRSINFLGGFVSFLLIWRLNQCYIRYQNGLELTSVFFCSLHSIAGVVCAYLRGADSRALSKLFSRTSVEDQPDDLKLFDGLASVVKINIVRMTLAIAIAFKYHCRVAENSESGEELRPDQVPGVLFDITRLKGLLYEEEKIIVDNLCGLTHLNAKKRPSGQVLRSDSVPTRIPSKARHSVLLRHSDLLQLPGWDTQPESQTPCAMPVVLVQLMRDIIVQAINQNWGYPERILNICEMYLKEISQAFEQLDRLITIPLPLAYLQHCKVLFLAFISTYPLTIHTSQGIWANIFSPCLLYLALFGFEVLADEMENPIGDDALDLNIMRMIHDLESRLCQLMSVTEVFRDSLRQSMCEPLDEMGMLGEISWKDGKHQRTDSFSKTFGWVPFPAHVIAYLGQKEHGVGETLLRNAGLRPSGVCSCCGTHDTTDLDEKESALVREAENYNVVTSFLCLRKEKDETMSSCRRQLVNFLGLDIRADGLDSQNTGLVRARTDGYVSVPVQTPGREGMAD